MDRGSFLAADLLILDDLGLHRLTGQQSANLYELIVSRRRVSTFVMTSNRAVENWLSLIDDPMGQQRPRRTGQRQLPRPSSRAPATGSGCRPTGTY